MKEQRCSPEQTKRKEAFKAMLKLPPEERKALASAEIARRQNCSNVEVHSLQLASVPAVTVPS